MWAVNYYVLKRRRLAISMPILLEEGGIANLRGFNFEYFGFTEEDHVYAELALLGPPDEDEDMVVDHCIFVLSHYGIRIVVEWAYKVLRERGLHPVPWGVEK